jgi:hypothetical protein
MTSEVYQKIDNLRIKYKYFERIFDDDNTISIKYLVQQLEYNKILFEVVDNLEYDWYKFLYELDKILNTKNFYNLYKDSLLVILRKEKCIKLLNE